MTQPSQKQPIKQSTNHTQNSSIVTKVHEATMKLLEKQKHIQTVKNRCTVLKVQQQQNRYRTLQQQRKIKQFEQLRQQVAKQKATSQRMLLSRLHQIDDLKQRNHKLKSINEEKIKGVKEELVNHKVHSNQKLKQLSQKNQQRISMMKKIDFQEKQQRRMELDRIKQLQRIHINQFKDQRTLQIQNKKNQYIMELNLKAKKRQKQLQILANVEQQALRKHAQSIRTSQLVRNKLRSVLHSSRPSAGQTTNRSVESQNQNKSLDRYTLQA